MPFKAWQWARKKRIGAQTLLNVSQEFYQRGNYSPYTGNVEPLHRGSLNRSKFPNSDERILMNARKWRQPQFFPLTPFVQAYTFLSRLIIPQQIFKPTKKKNGLLPPSGPLARSPFVLCSNILPPLFYLFFLLRPWVEWKSIFACFSAQFSFFFSPSLLSLKKRGEMSRGRGPTTNDIPRIRLQKTLRVLKWWDISLVENILAAEGVDVNVLDKDGRTALIHSCIHGH